MFSPWSDVYIRADIAPLFPSIVISPASSRSVSSASRKAAFGTSKNDSLCSVAYRAVLSALSRLSRYGRNPSGAGDRAFFTDKLENGEIFPFAVLREMIGEDAFYLQSHFSLFDGAM